MPTLVDDEEQKLRTLTEDESARTAEHGENSRGFETRGVATQTLRFAHFMRHTNTYPKRFRIPVRPKTASQTLQLSETLRLLAK